MSQGRSLETLGGRIYAARLWQASLQRRPIVQATIADALDVAPQTVGRWEADLKEPNLATIARLAQWLGVSAGWLAFGEGEMIAAASATPPTPLPAPPLAPADRSREQLLASDALDRRKTGKRRA